MRSRALLGWSLVGWSVVGSMVLLTGACSNDEPGSEGRYCTTVGDNLTALRTPAISTPEDVERILELYRTLNDAAPLAIEPEWVVLVDSIEAAVAVNPDDPASVQRAVDAARSSQPAANRVIEYTQQLCGVTFGELPPPLPAATIPTTEG